MTKKIFFVGFYFLGRDCGLVVQLGAKSRRGEEAKGRRGEKAKSRDIDKGGCSLVR